MVRRYGGRKCDVPTDTVRNVTSTVVIGGNDRLFLDEPYRGDDGMSQHISVNNNAWRIEGWAS